MELGSYGFDSFSKFESEQIKLSHSKHSEELTQTWRPCVTQPYDIRQAESSSVILKSGKLKSREKCAQVEWIKCELKTEDCDTGFKAKGEVVPHYHSPTLGGWPTRVVPFLAQAAGVWPGLKHSVDSVLKIVQTKRDSCVQVSSAEHEIWQKKGLRC